MDMPTVFTCGNVPKGANAIAADQLNAVQLRAIRTWPKTCDDCGKQTKWVEQQTLFDLLPATNKKVRIGGRRHGNKNNPNTYTH